MSIVLYSSEPTVATENERQRYPLPSRLPYILHCAASRPRHLPSGLLHANNDLRSDPGMEGLVRSLSGALPAFQDVETVNVSGEKTLFSFLWWMGKNAA